MSQIQDGGGLTVIARCHYSGLGLQFAGFGSMPRILQIFAPKKTELSRGVWLEYLIKSHGSVQGA